jgi:hypothetical protein
LLRNVREGRGNWLIIELQTESGSPAIGASTFIEVGEKRLRRDCLPCRGYASSSDPRVHVGLADTKQVESIEVRWVDGTSEFFGPFEANRVVTIRRGQGRSE